MALCAAAVLSVSACRDGDDQTVGAEGADKGVAEADADPEQSGPLAGQEDLSEYGITYRVPDGWGQPPSQLGNLGLEGDRPEVAHAITRTDDAYVAFASITVIDQDTSDGKAVSTAELAVNLRLLLGLASMDISEDSQEQYTVPGTEEATRVDIVFGEADQEMTMLFVDIGAGAVAVLSVGIDHSTEPTPDEVPDGIVEDILASVSVG
jgi:hypothetical protein